MISTISSDVIDKFIPFTSNGDILLFTDCILNKVPSLRLINTSPSSFALLSTVAKFRSALENVKVIIFSPQLFLCQYF